MIQNLPPETIFEFIVRDFEDAWNALADSSSARNRGNFLFARQTMVQLEWVARLAGTDATGSALADYSAEPNRIEPRYFTQLPGSAPKPKDFYLPSVSSANQERQLLWALYDLIRHGQAHQYQQIPVELSDGKDFLAEEKGSGVLNWMCRGMLSIAD